MIDEKDCKIKFEIYDCRGCDRRCICNLRGKWLAQGVFEKRDIRMER